MISASLTTQLERDKQLLTLSSSAIGLLVTLLRTVGVSNLLQVVFFGIALIAFLVTVISVLDILSKNATYIDEMLDGCRTESKYLIFLDRVAMTSFITGMIMVVIIGMYSATISLGQKGANMNKDNISNTPGESVKIRGDSWGRAYKLDRESPKVVEPKPGTASNVSTSSASSESSGGGNTSKPDGSSPPK